MRIDEEKLIALLTERTDYNVGKTQEQLHLLKERLNRVKETGEPFEIQHFGVFASQDGKLHFEPDEQLQTEINQKYAGMRPIELMEAFQEKGAGVPVEEAPQEPVSAEEEAKSEEREPVLPEKYEAPVMTESEGKDGGQESPAQPEAEVPPVPTADAEEETDAGKFPEKPKEKSFKKPEFHRDQRKRGGASVIVAVAAVIIIILGGGWILYTSGAFNGDGKKKNAAASDTTSVNSQRQISSAAPGDSLLNPQSQTDTTEQNGAANVSTRKQTEPTYGLKGITVDSLKNAYTIVIHSFRLKSTVQDIADSLKQEGYRTVLFERSVNDASRWRLGLGQFKSIESAQDAARKLTASYKNNHFITRFNFKN